MCEQHVCLGRKAWAGSAEMRVSCAQRSMLGPGHQHITLLTSRTFLPCRASDMLRHAPCLGATDYSGIAFCCCCFQPHLEVLMAHSWLCA